MTAQTLHRPEGPRHFLHYSAGGRNPVVIFLAGTGGTAAWAAEETRLPAITASGFDVVIPEAMRPRPDEPPKFITNPPRWNDGSPPPTPEMATSVDDVGFLNDLLDHLNAPQVFLAGFSNGAGMVFRYASELAGRLTAIAPVAGLWFPGVARPSKPLPTLYVLGDADALIPPRGGDVHLPWGHGLAKRPPVRHSLEVWATAIGCGHDSTIKHFDGYREERFPGPVPFTYVAIDGLGHHWPGGRGQLNPRLAGPFRETLDLNQRLVEFFRSSLESRL